MQAAGGSVRGQLLTFLELTKTRCCPPGLVPSVCCWVVPPLCEVELPSDNRLWNLNNHIPTEQLRDRLACGIPLESRAAQWSLRMSHYFP